MDRLREWRRPPVPEVGRIDVLAAVRSRTPVPPVPLSGPVSDALHARLTPEQVAGLERRLEGNLRAMWNDLPASGRRRLLVAAAAFYGDREALSATGLTSATPPDHVHTMARGPLTHGGDLGIADTVADTLLDAGIALRAGATVLDFGCSSGRVLRPIAAWRPDLVCLGCDPNADAIAWAQATLPMARWFRSPLRPPLDLGDASVDLAYAISIWSHFSAEAAEIWLQEMHRIVRPGGHLLLTVHGANTVATYARQALMEPQTLVGAIGTVLRDGVAFIDVFGEDGDWGVKDPAWGTCFMTADWLVERATPAWAVRLMRAGRLEADQDVFVLERLA